MPSSIPRVLTDGSRIFRGQYHLFLEYIICYSFGGNLKKSDTDATYGRISKLAHPISKQKFHPHLQSQYYNILTLREFCSYRFLVSRNSKKPIYRKHGNFCINIIDYRRTSYITHKNNIATKNQEIFEYCSIFPVRVKNVCN